MRKIGLILFLLVDTAFSEEIQSDLLKDKIERARICIAGLDFECASIELSACRDMMENEGLETKVLIYRMSAEVALALKDFESAEKFLRLLLELNPEFTPQKGQWPPTWLEILKKAQDSVPDRMPPKVLLEEVEGKEGEMLEIRVRTEDRSGVGGVKCHIKGKGDFDLLTKDGKLWTVTIPKEFVSKPYLEVWLEAYDQLGNGPTMVGDEQSPIKIKVRGNREDAKSMLSNWWFWGVMSLAIIGGSVGAYYLLREGGNSSGKGIIEVRIEWPSH